jgi:hypothetical protein
MARRFFPFVCLDAIIGRAAERPASVAPRAVQHRDARPDLLVGNQQVNAGESFVSSFVSTRNCIIVPVTPRSPRSSVTIASPETEVLQIRPSPVFGLGRGRRRPLTAGELPA